MIHDSERCEAAAWVREHGGEARPAHEEGGKVTEHDMDLYAPLDDCGAEPERVCATCGNFDECPCGCRYGVCREYIKELENAALERTCRISFDEEAGCWRCSECGWDLTPGEEQFCPMCGAKVMTE